MLFYSLSTDLASVCLDTRVINLRHELDLRRLKWIVVSEIKINDKLSSNERRALGSINCDIPNHHVGLRGYNFYSIDWRSV